MTVPVTTRRVSFYFSAHQDDWQLFMNPAAFKDVLDGDSKCVFIHLTAGDAGLGSNNAGRKHPLYLARENGAESAIRFMADSDDRPPVEKLAVAISCNGHPIYRVSYRNTVAYFLRLPDGNPAGTGYAATGHQSLKRLANGQIVTLTAIDDTTSYHGWNDLVATLRSIIDFERGDAPSVQFNAGRKHPLYLARENGAESAIRFMADSDDRPPVDKVASVIAYNGHPIYRVSYRNTVAYFLRLPDGNPAGTGYAATGYQSLMRLADGQIVTLTAIDDTTSYHGWNDLVATLRSVIDFERGNVPSVQLNVPEPDPVINLNDHADHFMTAKAALEAAEGLPDARRRLYIGYTCADRPENLSGHERDMKCAVYAVTLAGVLAFDQPTAWRHYDSTYIGRNYFRVDEGELGVPPAW